jgi:hypothetical protein
MAQWAKVMLGPIFKNVEKCFTLLWKWPRGNFGARVSVVTTVESRAPGPL